MMQKMMQFIFVVCFVILACRALSYDDLPERCFAPEEDPRCRALSGRYIYNPRTNVCEKKYTCWDNEHGFFYKSKCKRYCKVNKK
uniref:Putative salivary kunitz domain protein n=1 Tax=Ixodes ricinus TaxID=34613 RepID=A0A6B0U715_IXORI